MALKSLVRINVAIYQKMYKNLAESKERKKNNRKTGVYYGYSWSSSTKK